MAHFFPFVVLALAALTSAEWPSSRADPPDAISCSDAGDCAVHCPIAHQGSCESKKCVCNIQPTYSCNDARDCAFRCPVTHKGDCKADRTCSCNPIPGSFFCNEDRDCRIHCPFTHDGKCQTKQSNNQTCTCNFNPQIPCRFDIGCQFRCPVTHRGSCKDNDICSCDPIPAWLLPSTNTPPPPASTTSPATPGYYCVNNLDCSIHCPTTHKGACQNDSTCACDPHVDGGPVRCQNTADCIKHCLATHVGSCQSSHTCRCLMDSDSILG